MNNDGRGIAERFVVAYSEGDTAKALSEVADNVVYTLYISEDLLPLGGQTVGRDNLLAALKRVRSDFDYLVYRGSGYVTDGKNVRLRIEFMYRHRASGEILSGRFRLVMQIVRGAVVRVDEYHDRAMVEAFLRLFGQAR